MKVPSGWEKYPVGKLCQSIVPGRNKPKIFDGDIPWVTTPEILGRYIPSIKQRNYISKIEANNCGAKIVPEGAVVIAAVGELGVTAIANEQVVLNQQLHAFVCSTKVNNEYLAYFLSSQKAYMDSIASKTTIPYMNKTNCESIPVLLPPLQEQRKIAKILATWDKAISTTEKLISSSKQQKKALMQQLLTGKKRLIDPKTGKAFEGYWKKVPLSECSECLDNKRVPLNGEQRSEMKGSFPYWGANGIVDFVNNYLFDETIVLLAEDGGYFDEYATRSIANISYGKCWVNNHAHIIKAKGNAINEWLYFSLVHKNILAFINGGTRAKLNKKDMLLIKILLPSVQEQQKIAQVLTAADKEIETLEAKLIHLKQEKKALMQQLLTGKRRVKVDEINQEAEFA